MSESAGLIPSFPDRRCGVVHPCHRPRVVLQHRPYPNRTGAKKVREEAAGQQPRCLSKAKPVIRPISSCPGCASSSSRFTQ